MTRDDIIRLAEESGLEDGLYPYGALWESIERFAILVAEKEREACERECENWVLAKYAAAAIRARGEDK
jgi:hypothetical protein